MENSKYSVVIPSSRHITKIIPTLQSLDNQTVHADKVYIVYDRILTQPDIDTIVHQLQQELSASFLQTLELVTHITHAFQPGQGVSYVRNFGAQLVSSPFLLFVDDDNTFAHNFIAHLLQVQQDYFSLHQQYPILIPTERYQGTVRSQGYQSFNYFLGIQIPAKASNQIQIGKYDCIPIQFSSSNCLFAATTIFQDYPFDETMRFVYEDFDMTRRASHSGIPVLCLATIAIEHHMTPKTSLQRTYIADTFTAYQKTKNRTIFVRHTASSFQLRTYYLFGLRIHTAFLIYKIIFYAPSRDKIRLQWAVRRGTFAGLTTRV